MLGCGVVDTFSFNMTNLGQGSTLKNKFQIGALIAALMSIPAIFMQASDSHYLQDFGGLLLIIVWLFFVLEITVLLMLAPNNWAWIRGHKLEILVVIGSAPVFALMGETEMVFGLTPFLVISRFLRLVKFVKFLKIGKLLKALKIVKNDDSLPEWVDVFVIFVVSILATGIIGMIIDKESHSITDGIVYWVDLLRSDFHINLRYLIISFSVILTAGFVLVVKKQIEKTTIQ